MPARVEPDVKEQAEKVLDELGIPMSNTMGMYLCQVVLQRGIPFDMKLQERTPLAYGSLSKNRFDMEISKWMTNALFCRRIFRLK